MVDAWDLKSLGCKAVPVRVRPRVFQRALYAGIHYRFDFEAGLALGRAVAAKAEATNLNEVAVLP
jgi:hypothetical protein